MIKRFTAVIMGGFMLLIAATVPTSSLDMSNMQEYEFQYGDVFELAKCHSMTMALKNQAIISKNFLTAMAQENTQKLASESFFERSSADFKIRLKHIDNNIGLYDLRLSLLSDMQKDIIETNRVEVTHLAKEFTAETQRFIKMLGEASIAAVANTDRHVAMIRYFIQEGDKCQDMIKDWQQGKVVDTKIN